MSTTASSRDWRTTLRSLLRWLPGLIVTLLAFWLLARNVDWREFLATLSSMPVSILALAVAIYLVSMVVRAMGWRTLLQLKVSPGRTILVLNEGYFINNILPLRLGELGRAVLMGRHSQFGTFHVLSTIVVERSYDLTIASGLLLLTLPLVLKMDWARPIAIVLLGVILLGLLALYMAARHQEKLEGWLSRFTIRWPFFRRWVLPPLHSLLNGFSVLNRLDLFAISFSWLALSWFLAILRDWFLLSTLVPGAPFWWAVLAVSASNLGGALPSAAASLGVFEAAAVAALSLVGVPAEAALTYALIVHVVHLIFSSLIGAYGLSQEGKSLTEIYSDLRSANRT